ncbi:MAG: hypothetical protein KME64_36065 [Scytonematopsis contorta HA4267-MV1]|jgi:hypothetical protein|nr:hypothetical protein [Scytonematopsis contorta HA4267-MV1]
MKMKQMKQQLELSKCCLLFGTSLLASCMFAISPSRAATFAFSEGSLTFTGFSKNPSGTSTDFNEFVRAISKDGSVIATANGDVNFTVVPPQASSISSSSASGNNGDYLGQAKSDTTLLGSFLVEENQVFSFDFETLFNLKTSIDNSAKESANTFGDTFWQLVDTSDNSVLEFFSITGNLATEGDNDFLDIQSSNNIVFNSLSQDIASGGKKESAVAVVKGSLRHSFTKQTRLSLIGINTNRTEVKVPESSNAMIFLLSSGILGILIKRKQEDKATIL